MEVQAIVTRQACSTVPQVAALRFPNPAYGCFHGVTAQKCYLAPKCGTKWYN